MTKLNGTKFVLQTVAQVDAAPYINDDDDSVSMRTMTRFVIDRRPLNASASSSSFVTTVRTTDLIYLSR